MRCTALRIIGQVQGVSFRETARRKAEELGLAGFIRNEPDGSVYAEAEGEDARIDQFIAWCREGSEHAEVEQVEATRLPLRDFDGFRVER